MRRRSSAFTYVAERSLGLPNDFRDALFSEEARDMQAATRNYIYDGGMRVWSMELDPVEERYLLVGTAQSMLALYDLKALDDKDDAAELLAGKPSAAAAIAHFDTANRLPPCSLINTHLVRRDAHAHASRSASSAPRGISSVDWYPVDGGLVVTSGFDGLVKVWDADVFRVECEFAFPGTKVFGAKFSPVSTTHALIAAVTASHEVRLCDMATESAVHSLLGHRDEVWSLAWSRASEFQLCTGSRNGEIRVWDIRRSGATACLLALNQDGVADVPGRRGASLTTNARRPARPMSLQAAATPSPSPSAARAGSGRQQAERERDQQRLKRRRVADDEAARSASQRTRSDPHQAAAVSLARAHSSAVNALAFTPDGRFLLSSGHDDKLRLWHAATGEHLFANYEATVSSKVARGVQLAVVQEGAAASGTLVFHPNGADGELAAYAVHGSDGKPVSRYTAHYRSIGACCYRKTRRQLFTGGVDGLIMKWAPRSVAICRREDGADDACDSGDRQQRGVEEDAWSDDEEDERDADDAHVFVPPILRQ
ncbi:hypothetical protein P43SY_002005 [Pythium insidiosum]|uniref:Rhodanese domain-containing protein n=1 Tax=Pythium insidiosum TaxID=114742 RepID=A0AAD5QBA4_PYTIN|nr:hypothetical protein P43SY_002005 [Pythium insidiosum]